VLTSKQKKYVSEIFGYYFSTTKTDISTTITQLSQLLVTPNDASILSTYSGWLLSKIIEMLRARGIDPHEALENKHMLRKLAEDEFDREAGEFFTPEVWAFLGREYIEREYPGLWDSANIWELSCGTGNLLKSAKLNPDKTFMSTLMREDVDTCKALFPDCTVFQLDALAGIDFDEHNRKFSEQLPPNLVAKLEANEPFIFYINPPYKLGSSLRTDVGQYMYQIGYSRAASDVCIQFLYRICLLIEYYKLTNVTIGIFEPVTWLLSNYLADFKDYFFSIFGFKAGYGFSSYDFTGLSTSVPWLLGYLVFSTQEKNTDIVLDAYKLVSGEPKKLGTLPLKPVDTRLYDWCKPNDVLEYTYMPQQSSAFVFKNKMLKAAKNAFLYLMTSTNVTRATDRCSITTFPNDASCVPITQDNFVRAMLLFSSASAISSGDAFLSRQQFQVPDMSLPGYKTFEVDSIIYAAFCYNSAVVSIRNKQINGGTYTLNNPLFPLTIEQCKHIITDPVLLADMENNPPNNQVFLDYLAKNISYASKEAVDFYNFILKQFAISLSGTVRKDCGYDNELDKYDAGFVQIRRSKIWTEEQDKGLKDTLGALRSTLFQRLNTYKVLTFVKGEEVYE